MIQDKIFLDEKDPTGLSYNTPFTVYGSYQGRLWSKTPSGSIQYYSQNSDLSAYATTGSNQFNGSQTITGSLTVTGGISGSSAESASYALNADKIDNLDSTQLVLTSSFNSYTSSASSSVGSLSSSVATTTSGLGGRITTIEGRGATTGSNTFIGSQVITGSLYITTDLIVQGSSSLQNITASAVSIGTNTVILNTDTPAVRFAGISVQDSGSNAGVTGSIFWDGLCNRWVYSNPSGIGYSGGMLLSGPRTSTLGTESPLTCNYIAKSGGGDHLYDSCIYDNGTTICIIATNTIFSGGCVNIGNSPQDFTFNVGTTCVGTNAAIAQFYNNDYTAGTRGFIRVRNNTNSGSTTSAYFGQGVDQKTYFYNNDPSRAGDMVITNTGKVGIGTPSPIAQLHIKTDVASESRPTNLATSATNSAVFITTICGSTAGTAFGQIGANTNYIQGTYENGSSSTSLSLNPYGGNVGIGTPTPNSLLQIKGTNTYNLISSCFNGDYGSGFAFSDNLGGLNYDAGANTFCIYSNYANYGGIILSTATNSRMVVSSCGVTCFSCQVCAPQFTGGFVCAVGGLNVRGASTTWSTLNIFPDNPGGAGAQCKTVLAASIVGCTNHGPQLRFSGASGGFIDIGQDCNAGFVIEASDTPSLNVTQTSRVGIQNTAPQGKLEVGIVNNNTTAGGHFFSSFQIPVDTWSVVFYVPSNLQWNAVTEFTWTSAGDFNRSGAAYMRWAYEPGAATLGVVYTLFNNSQNATASFRRSGTEIQIYITGGAADYFVQVRIQGSRAS